VELSLSFQSVLAVGADDGPLAFPTVLLLFISLDIIFKNKLKLRIIP
jgi:hypothetical protein